MVNRAPRWREMLAGLLDVSLVGGLLWLVRRQQGGAAAAAERLRWLRYVPADALREQLRTPGQRLLGIRTVDRRTGQRVALWRTLALVGVAGGSQLIVNRLKPPDTPAQEREREAFVEEMQAIMRRHPQRSPERDAERQALLARHQSTLPGRDLQRALALTFLAGLVTRRLRRRLAPTREILVRRRVDHRP